MRSKNLSSQKKRGSKKTLAKRLAESAGILFSALLVFSAIVYAITWSPGDPPQAAPGDGNVLLEEVLWTKNGPTKIFYNGGNVGIGATEPSEKLEVNGNIKINNEIIFEGGGYIIDDGSQLIIGRN